MADFEVQPFIAGHHVTTDSGTGFGSYLPSHGVDDFEIGKEVWVRNSPTTFSDDGYYHDHVPLFAGKHIYKVHTDVMQSSRILKDC